MINPELTVMFEQDPGAGSGEWVRVVPEPQRIDRAAGTGTSHAALYDEAGTRLATASAPLLPVTWPFS